MTKTKEFPRVRGDVYQQNMPPIVQKPKIIQFLQDHLSYSDYLSLPQKIGVSKSKFSRLENTGKFCYREVHELLLFIYSKFAITGAVPPPEEFVKLYELNHLTIEEIQKLQNLGC